MQTISKRRMHEILLRQFELRHQRITQELPRRSPTRPYSLFPSPPPRTSTHANARPSRPASHRAPDSPSPPTNGKWRWRAATTTARDDNGLTQVARMGLAPIPSPLRLPAHVPPRHLRRTPGTSRSPRIPSAHHPSLALTAAPTLCAHHRHITGV